MFLILHQENWLNDNYINIKINILIIDNIMMKLIK